MTFKSFIFRNLVLIGILLMLILSTKFILAEEIKNKLKNEDQQTLEQHGPSDRFDRGAEDLMKKGENLQKKGKYAEAISVYESVKRKYPNTTYENEISGGTYSRDAGEQIVILKACIIPRNSPYLKSSDSQNNFIKLIREAFNKKDLRPIEGYMSCYYTVGFTESDNIWNLLPNQVIPSINDLGDKLDWSSLSLESVKGSDYVNVKLKGNLDDYSLTLIKIPGGWVWSGFYTSNRQLLERLSKINLEDHTK